MTARIRGRLFIGRAPCAGGDPAGNEGDLVGRKGLALGRHAAVVLSGFLIILALRAATDFIPDRLWDQLWLGSLFDLVDNAVWALLLTPVVIAVHRFVIQDVVTRSYTWPLGDPAYRLFFVWLFALKVLEGVPFTLLGAMQEFNWPLLPTTAVFAVALIGAIVLVDAKRGQGAACRKIGLGVR